MPSSIYFPTTSNGRTSQNGLPYHSSAVQEKIEAQSAQRQLSPAWTISLAVPIPGLRTRALRLWFINPGRIHHLTITRFGRRKGTLFLGLVSVLAILFLLSLVRHFGNGEQTRPGPFSDPATLVYKREDLIRIWKWEVSSGHYPSRRPSQSLFYSSPQIITNVPFSPGRSGPKHSPIQPRPSSTSDFQ
jgi:DDB1- and CUL4-associated factor 13